LVVVPTTLLKEQWEERIQAHTDLVLGKDIFVMTYQGAIKGAMKVLAQLGVDQWGTVTFDEQHHQPEHEIPCAAYLDRCDHPAARELNSCGCTRSPAERGEASLHEAHGKEHDTEREEDTGRALGGRWLRARDDAIAGVP
jgi:hypothetical protein